MSVPGFDHVAYKETDSLQIDEFLLELLISIHFHITGHRRPIQIGGFVGQRQNWNYVLTGFPDNLYLSNDIQLFSAWYSGNCL